MEQFQKLHSPMEGGCCLWRPFPGFGFGARRELGTGVTVVNHEWRDRATRLNKKERGGIERAKNSIAHESIVGMRESYCL